MGETRPERKLLREFAEFIDARPADPGETVDKAILRRVGRDLQPIRWKAYAKFALVEVTAGLLTLTICPQFGVGFGRHNEPLHALHSAAPPAVFHLLCGLFFVILGASLGGLVLSQDEIRGFSHHHRLYFATYSILAYVTLVALGVEIFVLSSSTWILGAMAGNLIGFWASLRLRRAIAW